MIRKSQFIFIDLQFIPGIIAKSISNID